MFARLLALIFNGGADSLSRDERNSFFEAVANVSENNIAAKVGHEGKEAIMRWWYRMCDIRAKERKGG